MAQNRSGLGPPTSPRVGFWCNGHAESDFWGPGAVGGQISGFWRPGMTNFLPNHLCAYAMSLNIGSDSILVPPELPPYMCGGSFCITGGEIRKGGGGIFSPLSSRLRETPKPGSRSHPRTKGSRSRVAHLNISLNMSLGLRPAPAAFGSRRPPSGANPLPHLR